MFLGSLGMMEAPNLWLRWEGPLRGALWGWGEKPQPGSDGTRPECGQKEVLLFCPGRYLSLRVLGSRNLPGRELHQSETGEGAEGQNIGLHQHHPPRHCTHMEGLLGVSEEGGVNQRSGFNQPRVREVGGNNIR